MRFSMKRVASLQQSTSQSHLSRLACHGDEPTSAPFVTHFLTCSSCCSPLLRLGELGLPRTNLTAPTWFLCAWSSLRAIINWRCYWNLGVGHRVSSTKQARWSHRQKSAGCRPSVRICWRTRRWTKVNDAPGAPMFWQLLADAWRKSVLLCVRKWIVCFLCAATLLLQPTEGEFAKRKCSLSAHTEGLLVWKSCPCVVFETFNHVAFDLLFPASHSAEGYSVVLPEKLSDGKWNVYRSADTA